MKEKSLFSWIMRPHTPSQQQLKNVKIIPPPTTSHCQPLDQGIIQNFKVQYRRMLLTRILIEFDKCKSADELANIIIIVLNANMWVKTAVREIKKSCMTKCFQKADFNFDKYMDENIQKQQNDYNCSSSDSLMARLPTSTSRPLIMK